jgi:hypothetical protein
MSEKGISASHSGAAGSSASHHPTGTAQPNAGTTNSMTLSGLLSLPFHHSKLGVVINLGSRGRYDQLSSHIVANNQGLAILHLLKLSDFIDLDSPDLSIMPGLFTKSSCLQAKLFAKPPSDANAMKATYFHKKLHDFVIDEDGC